MPEEYQFVIDPSLQARYDRINMLQPETRELPEPYRYEPMRDPALANRSYASQMNALDTKDTKSTGGFEANPTAGYQMMSGVATEKSGAGKLGAGLAGAGVASGNPYLAATGVGLQAIGAIGDEKRKREAEALESRNDRRQMIINALGGFRGAVV